MNESLTMLANRESANAGRKVYLSIINEDTKKPGEIQEQLLMELLKDNSDTVYGKKYEFADIRTVDDYREKVPVLVPALDILATILQKLLYYHIMLSRSPDCIERLILNKSRGGRYIHL